MIASWTNLCTLTSVHKAYIEALTAILGLDTSCVIVI